MASKSITGFEVGQVTTYTCYISMYNQHALCVLVFWEPVSFRQRPLQYRTISGVREV